MAIPPVSEPVPCPRCGSLDVLSFSDGSGKCRNCGNAFRGKGRLDSGAAAQSGLATPAAVEEAQAGGRSTQILVGALGGIGGLLLLLAVPIGVTVLAGLGGKTTETILAPLFRDTRAIGFCFLALALTGIGAWGLYTAYQHAVGNIPYGGTLVTIGLVALVVSGLLVLLLGLSATLIGAAGGGLVLVAGALDLRLG